MIEVKPDSRNGTWTLHLGITTVMKQQSLVWNPAKPMSSSLSQGSLTLTKQITISVMTLSKRKVFVCLILISTKTGTSEPQLAQILMMTSVWDAIERLLRLPTYRGKSILVWLTFCRCVKKMTWISSQSEAREVSWTTSNKISTNTKGSIVSTIWIHMTDTCSRSLWKTILDGLVRAM